MSHSNRKILLRKTLTFISSDDEYEQGMEHSGCNDSKKVTDETHTHHFFIYSRLKEREDTKFNV